MFFVLLLLGKQVARSGHNTTKLLGKVLLSFFTPESCKNLPLQVNMHKSGDKVSSNCLQYVTYTPKFSNILDIPCK